MGKPALKIFSPEDKAEQVAKEYEDFAYIVSHDLNAPLRHVKEFTRLLIGGRRDELTEEEREYVGFLEMSLERIDDMQRALLTFSRLNTRAGEMREVNMNHAVAAALKELEGVINAHSPTVECAALPSITAEPKQMELLFFHLIDNALKFHEGDERRKVFISAADQGEAWHFEIRDNGIGIAEKYHAEVFRMFRRLEPGKYKGIGAGLTIAHKIAGRHGGDMIIKSVPGKGTTVLFSILKS